MLVSYEMLLQGSFAYSMATLAQVDDPLDIPLSLCTMLQTFAKQFLFALGGASLVIGIFFVTGYALNPKFRGYCGDGFRGLFDSVSGSVTRTANIVVDFMSDNVYRFVCPVTHKTITVKEGLLLEGGIRKLQDLSIEQQDACERILESLLILDAIEICMNTKGDTLPVMEGRTRPVKAAGVDGFVRYDDGSSRYDDELDRQVKTYWNDKWNAGYSENACNELATLFKEKEVCLEMHDNILTFSRQSDENIQLLNNLKDRIEAASNKAEQIYSGSWEAFGGKFQSRTNFRSWKKNVRGKGKSGGGPMKPQEPGPNSQQNNWLQRKLPII